MPPIHQDRTNPGLVLGLALDLPGFRRHIQRILGDKAAALLIGGKNGHVQHDVAIHQVHRIQVAPVIRAIRFPAIFGIGTCLGQEQVAERTDDDKRPQQLGQFHELTLEADFFAALGRAEN